MNSLMPLGAIIYEGIPGPLPPCRWYCSDEKIKKCEDTGYECAAFEKWANKREADKC